MLHGDDCALIRKLLPVPRFRRPFGRDGQRGVENHVDRQPVLGVAARRFLPHERAAVHDNLGLPALPAQAGTDMDKFLQAPRAAHSAPHDCVPRALQRPAAALGRNDD